MTKAHVPCRLKLTFNEAHIGQPLLNELARKTRVVPNIIRGVIKGSGGWLDVELIGSPKSVERAMKFLKARAVTVATL